MKELQDKFTPRQAAKESGYTKDTVLNMIRRGNIEAELVTVGEVNMYFIPKEEVEFLRQKYIHKVREKSKSNV